MIEFAKKKKKKSLNIFMHSLCCIFNNNKNQKTYLRDRWIEIFFFDFEVKKVLLCSKKLMK